MFIEPQNNSSVALCCSIACVYCICTWLTAQNHVSYAYHFKMNFDSSPSSFAVYYTTSFSSCLPFEHCNSLLAQCHMLLHSPPHKWKHEWKELLHFLVGSSIGAQAIRRSSCPFQRRNFPKIWLIVIPVLCKFGNKCVKSLRCSRSKCV